MADFEDSNSPTWANMTEGQENLAAGDPRDARHAEDGKDYELTDDPALLLARVRGLHLPEKHLDSGVCGAFMDFALYVRHNHEALAERGWGPFFYVPKLESHLEARLWNRAFEIAEEELGARARHDPRHRPDRDDPRRLRDGGDPLRAARPRRRPQRRPLGLPVLDDQVLPRAARSSCCPTATR